MRSLKILIGLVALIYTVAGALLFIFQRGFIYFPTPEFSHGYNVEVFSVNEEHINVVVLNSNKSNAVLYFGGNGESVAQSASNLAQVLSEHAVYLVNYRGYGGSTGQPTEKGIYADAEAIFDTLTQKHNSVSVIGRSLGSGVATYLAAKRNVEKLVLVTPYDSIQHIAQDRFPYFPMQLLLLDKYNSVMRANKIDCPILVILAQYDRVIPSRYSNLLIEAFAKKSITVEVIAGAGHNNLSESVQYHKLLGSI